MRRETFEKGGIPFEENLVFFTPLTENDLTDHINNVTPIASLGATWDSNKSAYMFRTNTGGQYCLRYYITNINNYQDGYTVSADVYVQSYNGTCDVVTFGYPIQIRESVSQSVAIVETHRFTGFATMGWHRIVQTSTRDNGSSYVRLYIDGSLVKEFTASSSSYPNLPISFWTGNVIDYITIGCGYYNYHYTAFFKNIMIFNRILNDSEVTQL